MCYDVDKGTEVEVGTDDRARLEAIVADRNGRQKHVERARIVLLTGDSVGTLGIMHEVGCAKATVWRWQERFAAEGVGGLLRDKSRPPGKAPLPRTVVERVVELTLGEPPGERPTGPAGRWPRRPACRCARCSGSGRRTLLGHRAAVDSAREAAADTPACRPSTRCEAGGEPLGGAGGERNAERDFHGERRRNDTHASTTDADARLFRKGRGKEAKLCHMGHLLMENRNGLIVDALLTPATGTAEREAAETMLARQTGRHRATLAADKA